MVETAKHTPGPWTADYEGNIRDADGNSLLDSGVEYAGEQDESPWVAIKNAADARLIAAAPDMLAALHAAVNWFTPPNDTKPFPLKEIADAIAKATGATND